MYHRRTMFRCSGTWPLLQSRRVPEEADRQVIKVLRCRHTRRRFRRAPLSVMTREDNLVAGRAGGSAERGGRSAERGGEARSAGGKRGARGGSVERGGEARSAGGSAERGGEARSARARGARGGSAERGARRETVLHQHLDHPNCVPLSGSSAEHTYI